MLTVLMYPLGSDVNECPEGLHRCYNGQCVVDLNQCPTPILNQTITEISSTRASQLQSSSIMSTSFDIVSPSSFYMSESSVTETTITSVESVIPTTEDNAPDNGNYVYQFIHSFLTKIKLKYFRLR